MVTINCAQASFTYNLIKCVPDFEFVANKEFLDEQIYLETEYWTRTKFYLYDGS